MTYVVFADKDTCTSVNRTLKKMCNINEDDTYRLPTQR